MNYDVLYRRLCYVKNINIFLFKIPLSDAAKRNWLVSRCRSPFLFSSLIPISFCFLGLSFDHFRTRGGKRTDCWASAVVIRWCVLDAPCNAVHYTVEKWMVEIFFFFSLSFVNYLTFYPDADPRGSHTVCPAVLKLTFYSLLLLQDYRPSRCAGSHCASLSARKGFFNPSG